MLYIVFINLQWIMKCKGWVCKCPWPNLKYNPCIFWEELRTTTKNSVKAVSGSAKIRTSHLQNTSLKCYHLFQLAAWTLNVSDIHGIQELALLPFSGNLVVTVQRKLFLIFLDQTWNSLNTNWWSAYRFSIWIVLRAILISANIENNLWVTLQCCY